MPVTDQVQVLLRRCRLGRVWCAAAVGCLACSTAFGFSAVAAVSKYRRLGLLRKMSKSGRMRSARLPSVGGPGLADMISGLQIQQLTATKAQQGWLLAEGQLAHLSILSIVMVLPAGGACCLAPSHRHKHDALWPQGSK